MGDVNKDDPMLVRLKFQLRTKTLRTIYALKCVCSFYQESLGNENARILPYRNMRSIANSRQLIQIR